MGRIYRNLKEIPIPAEGRLNHYDKKVSVYRKVNGQRRRTIIGAATSETTMIPNENFRIKFPELRRSFHFARNTVPLSCSRAESCVKRTDR